MSIEAADFDYICKVVRESSAIVLEKGKEYLVEARLYPVVRELGLESFPKLVEAVKKGDAAARTRVVEALTTNETSFFRDIEPFDFLRKDILPEIMKKRAATRQLTIWCAASSTGQEPYSMAMMLRENFPELTTWKVKIVATDINKEVLERAKRGVFTQLEVNRGLPITYLVKYFEKKGTEFHIKEDIKSMVHYLEMNLARPFTAVVGDIDIVLIRNVLIYFDSDTKKSILGKIRGVMKPDGFLFLGAAETTINLDENFVRRSAGRASCYHLKGASPG